MTKKFSKNLSEKYNDTKNHSTKPNFNKIKGLFSYIKPYKTLFLFGTICLFFSSAILLSFPYIAGKLIDVASGKLWMNLSINQISLFLIAILFLQGFFSFFRVYLFTKVSEKSMADLRLAVFSNLLTLPIPFFDKKRVGELISRITNDVSMLQSVFSTTLAELFRQITTLIVGVIIIFYLTPKLTLFMLLTFPFLVLGALIFGRFIRKLSKETQDLLAESNTVVEESLQAIHIVKAFTNELFEKHRYQKKLLKTVNFAVRTASYRGVFISFIILVLFGGIVAVMWYGARLVQTNQLSIGELISFILYTSFIGGSIAGLGDIYGQFQKAIGVSERVLEIVEEKAESHIEEKNDHYIIKGNIEYRNVNFSYPSRTSSNILKDISFSIDSGKTIAFVGPSGAGKTTIIQLLMKYYHTISGEILIDNMPISNISTKTLRQNIGIVPQDIILFGGTIEENIAYGNPKASKNQIIEAAKKANAWSFIEKFPNGIKTVVGERGIQLSGGQRQRVAIARTILKNPTILILDEATSNLDVESEREIQLALNSLIKERTTIIIAHRFATIKKADYIFVLEDGKIVEQGSRQDLASHSNGIFNQFSKLQS